MGKSLQTKQIANEVLWIVVGCLLYSLSVVWFIDPAQIIPGSVTGIAVVTKALFGIPIGVLNLVVNIPLVLIGVFYLGKKLLVYTALTVFLNSILMDQLAMVLQPMTQDMQVQAFRKVKGFSFASTMCIGNLRSGVEMLCSFLRKRDRGTLHGVACYFGVIALFAIGAGVGGFCIGWLGYRTIWLSGGLLLIGFMLLFLNSSR